MTFIATKLFHKAGEGSGGGGGGGDQHNLGWYATESALTTAHPTASNGDWAIVGATDTVWVWDSDTTAWKDTDTKGQVTSVNGQTGAVTVDTLPSQTGQSGKFLTTNGTNASWTAVNALQNTATGTNSLTIDGISSTSSYAVNIGNNSRSSGMATSVGSSSRASDYSVSFGYFAIANSYNSVAIGYYSNTIASDAIAIGYGAHGYSNDSVAIGYNAEVSVNTPYGIQIGTGTNSTANTFKVGNANGNFEIMSADGTIPEARLADTTNAQQGDVLTLDSTGNAVWQAASGGTQIQYSTMPDAAENAGRIVQYTGATSTQPPVFTITSESWAGAITISDPTRFRNALDTELLTNDGVQLTVGCEISCSYNDNPVSLSIEVTGIDSNTHYVTFNGSSAIANAGVAISADVGACTTIFSCDSLGGSVTYTNGYFYKSVSFGGGVVQFLCDTTKIEIVDPTLFITSVNNAMQGGTQVVDGTCFDIRCNNDGNGLTFNISIQAPDGQGGVLEDSGDLYTSLDPSTDIGLVVHAASNFFQTYAAYTSDTSEPHYYNYNPTNFSITDSQVFTDFVETFSAVTLQSDDDVHLDFDWPSGGAGIDVNVGITRNGNTIFDSQTTINSGQDIGMNINTSAIPTNTSFMFIAAGSAGGYQWEQVNVQPGSGSGEQPETVDPSTLQGMFMFGGTGNADEWIILHTVAAEPSENDPMYLPEGNPLPGLNIPVNAQYPNGPTIPYVGWLRVSRFDANTGIIYMKAGDIEIPMQGTM